jgi:hypothetical protein
LFGGNRAEEDAPSILPHPLLVAAPVTAKAVLSWLGDVDFEIATLVLLSVKALDRLLGVSCLLHFHEAKPAGTTRLSVRNHLGRGNSAVSCKQLVKTALGHLEGEITDIQLAGDNKHLSFGLRIAASNVRPKKQ